MLNWAKVWHGATKGGGVNGYQQALARSLVAKRHAVATLSSGTHDTPNNPEPRLRRHPDWHGIAAFEIVNSPVRAPAIRQFDEPQAEVSSPELEAVFADFIARWQPDVVHANSLEGLSIGCLDACRAAGARVAFSLHNYHTICPQVYLMHAKREVCLDSQNGHRCATCLDGATPMQPTAPAVPVSNSDDVRTRLDAPSPDPRDPLPVDRPSAPIVNLPIADPPSEQPPNAFGRRRHAMIDMLNRCDRVLAVSRFVADKFAAMGVDRDRLDTQHIGVEIVDRLRAQPLPKQDVNIGPLRLVFVGFHNRAKGLPVLLDALDSLDTSTLGELHVSIHAKGADAIEYRIRRLESRLARLTLSFGYEPADLPHLLGAADVGVVPSVWWDNGPQTVMEMLACGLPVIGSAVGGVPDFIEHERTGLLVEGNNHHQLAAAIARVAGDRELLAAMRANITPPKSMAEHADEIESLYRGLCTVPNSGAGVDVGGADA